MQLHGCPFRRGAGTLVESRLGRERPRVLIRPQQAKQAPHLGERLAAGPLDVQDRLARSLRLSPQQPAGPAGLDDDHAYTVGNDVLEVAADTHALLLDRRPRGSILLNVAPLKKAIKLAITVVSTPACSSRIAAVWRSTCGVIVFAVREEQRPAEWVACLILLDFRSS